jgi:hypothetical protein
MRKIDRENTFADKAEKQSPMLPEVSVNREMGPDNIEFALDRVQESLDKRWAALDQRVSSIQAEAQKTLDSPEQKSRKRKIFDKTMRISRAGLRATAGVSVLFFAFLAADHALTRWNVEQEQDPQTSRLKYKHQDPETTHIINVLSGQEQLSEEEELKLIKGHLTHDSFFPFVVASGAWQGSKEELAQADSTTIIAVLKSLKQHEHSESKPTEKTDEEYLKDYFTLEPGIEDDLVYKTLWELMEKAGNPKIRLGMGTGFLKHANGNYNSITNTI